MRAVFSKEFRSYFYSATGYIFMAVFLLISGLFFALSNLIQSSAYYNSVLSSITFVFLIIVPVITMRTLSEERHQKTDQLLLTAPVSITDIVLGKYFAAVCLFLTTLLITGIYPLILAIFGSISGWEILGGYIGFALLGSSFIAVGLFISSLTENQVGSAVGTFGALLVLWIVDWIQQGLPTTQTAGMIFAGLLVVLIAYAIYMATKNGYLGGITALLGAIAMLVIYLTKKSLYEGFTTKFFNWISILKRYDNFSMGILSISSVIYYISFCAAFIFLTIRMIDKRRWS